MKTKVTILGESHEDVTPKKKIEFIKFLDLDIKVKDIGKSQYPFSWDNIVLLNEDYTNCGLDLMYAYDNDGIGRILVLGHFNDGVV